jgi:DNA-directed RNA polymerase specialized sigma24 family protein
MAAGIFPRGDATGGNRRLAVASIRLAAPAPARYDAKHPSCVVGLIRRGCFMSAGGEGSVTGWIAGVKAGDAEAAQRLWRRYFDELVRLARARLGSTRRAAADEEDVALSAFYSLCAGAAQNRFDRLDGRDELWRLLVTITVRKAVDQVHYQRRQKRGGGCVIGEADLAVAGHAGEAGGLDRLAGHEPTPEFAAALDEQYRRLFDGLPDPSLRAVARLRLEGYTGAEIAARLGCNRRTVARKLEVIRRLWTETSLP